MVSGFAFILFGLGGGFVYLAYIKKQILLAYGLAGFAAAFFLQGTRALMGPETSTGMTRFVDILHHTALGVGGAFLVYVAATDGWKWFQAWKAKRREAEIAFQQRLAAVRTPNMAEGEKGVPGRSGTGKKTGVA